MLLKIKYQEKNTIIFVTHSIAEAIFLSDTVYVFSKRPAKVVLKLDINMPYPRNVEVRYSDHFKQLEQKAGEALGFIR